MDRYVTEIIWVSRTISEKLRTVNEFLTQILI
jgi:hypothetical protein